MKTVTLFSYGSIMLPEITQLYFKSQFTPVASVFIKGYKLILKHANSKTLPNYHHIICEPTGNENDLIPGFLVEIPENLINSLDKWEGKNYKRELITCYDRNLIPIECEIYVKSN